MNPRIKLFLVGGEGRTAFGPGKFRLLRAVEAHGSLLSASKALGVPLLHRSHGGQARGGATLTEFASKLLVAWEGYVTEV